MSLILLLTGEVIREGEPREVFTSSTTWVCPPGVHTLRTVECRGAGGAGGASVVNSGGGGGGGAYARSTNIPVTPGQSYAITVPQGPVATAGGDASFGTTVIAKGGDLGAAGSATAGGAGGAGGTAAASTGAVKFSGGTGGTASGITAGGGGGGAGDAANGGAGTGAVGGTGGTAGGGAGGNGASGAGIAPGGGGGGSSATSGTRGPGARGEVVLTYTEVGLLNTVALHTPLDSESIFERATELSIAVHEHEPAIIDEGSQTTVALHTGADGLAADQEIISAALHSLANESIRDVVSVITAALHDQLAAIVSAPGTVTTVAVHSQQEQLAEANLLTTVALHSGDVSLTDISTLTTIAIPSANWTRLGAGLSGKVYSALGTPPVPGAIVKVFRADTDVKVAEFISDASGNWSMEANPNLTYWIASWLDAVDPDDSVQDVTPLRMEPTLTIIETGT